MSLSLSRRAGAITQAEIRAMSLECERIGGVNLAQGVCDTPPPPLVVEAAAKAMRDGFNTYTRYDGRPELREAISEKLRRDQNVVVDPQTQITVSAGSTGAFYCACLALLNPGDEVILFEPYYGYHLNTLLAVEAVPVVVPMSPPEWSFTREQLERASTPRTKGIMLCSPSNPGGKVFALDELQAVSEFARAHDLFVFTDEIYEYFIYGEQKHISPFTLPDMSDRTILISGYSKTFSITGWRIGYSVASERWAQMIGHVNDLVYVCAPAPLQLGVAEGIRSLPKDFYRDVALEFLHKRDLLCETLARSGLEPSIPMGAYYVLARVDRLGFETSREASMSILSRTGVASVPGVSFFAGPEKNRYVRFCFAKPESDINEACRRIEKLINS